MREIKCIGRMCLKVLKFLGVALLYTFGLLLILFIILFVYFQVLTGEGQISASIIPDSVSIEASTLKCSFGKDLTISTDSTPFAVNMSSDSFEVDGETYTQQTKGAYSIISDDAYYNTQEGSVMVSEDGTYIEASPDIDLEMRELLYTIHISSNSDISAKFESGLYGVETSLDNRMRLVPTNRSFILIKSEEPITLTFDEHKMMLTNHKDIIVSQVKTLVCPANTDLRIYTNGTHQERLGVIETMEDKAFYDLKYDVLRDFQFESANCIKSKGTGKAYFFTTANPKVFDLEHQEIYVPPMLGGSSSNNISGKLENGRLVFQGQVESAEIMGYSIQPSIWDWMNESSNLIATIILTILGGAISLTIATLKDNGEKKEKKSNE